MYICRGSLISMNKDAPPVLQTPEGEKYEVSFLAAFVWQLLDGNKNLSELVHEVKTSSKVQGDDLPLILSSIIDELQKVNLVKRLG